MNQPAQTAADVRDNLTANLDWRFAARNDIAVAQSLHQGHPVDAVYTLDEAGLLDGFFKFLQELQILAHWQTFTFDRVYRVFLPAIYFVLLYGTRVLLGITSSNALPALLFSDVAVMTLVGFNAYLVAHGMTQRGAQQRTGERPYPDGSPNPSPYDLQSQRRGAGGPVQRYDPVAGGGAYLSRASHGGGGWHQDSHDAPLSGLRATTGNTAQAPT